MQPARLPASRGSVRVWDLFFLSLLVPLAAAALQQQPVYASSKRVDELSSAAASAASQWRAVDSLDTRHSGQRARRDPGVSNIHTDDKARTSRFNERALATVSPAEANSAVRDLPALRSADSTAGITRQQARSLQDWQVEDLMLLATVDGKLHARDRQTGASRWTLEVDREMVQMTRHARKNRTVDEDGREYEDPIFIVEPSQDGSVYVLAPGHGLQKLDYTVKQLFELAPYRDDGPPALQYTAEKKTTLYTVDAATGLILDTSSASGSTVNEDERCKLTSGFEDLEDGECKTSGVLTLGRTEYTIGISDSNTKEQIITLDYFEWETNRRDQDLQRQHTSSKDDQYIYTKYDGTFYGVDVSSGSRQRRLPVPKAVFHHKFPSPVVRVFDVVRRPGDSSGDANLALLSQPVGPPTNVFDGLEEDPFENVFINCTESGNWYALSEANYPSVADGAADAKCYTDMLLYGRSSRGIESHLERDQFSGVYRLPSQGELPQKYLIGDAGQRPGIDPPPHEQVRDPVNGRAPVPATLDGGEYALSLRAVIAIVMSFLALLASSGYLYKQYRSGAIKLQKPDALSNLVMVKTDASAVQDTNGELPMVREAEPAEETIFGPGEIAPTRVHLPMVTDTELNVEKGEVDTGEGDDDPKENGEPAKKKATRGKRGGRKQKEKQQAAEDAKSKRHPPQVIQAAEIISVAASESPQISGPLQINSLVIHTDRVIGQGSCGTIVFQGKFEGRDVAVKRMLSQYYELASQEVSFLQQSDDHQNVVRYFCQQKDDHFLYIAVELCQASLFEVWDADKAKDEARQRQLQSLKLAIEGDMIRTLHQLAAGLCHLHNLRIIHRDIKPQNILVGFPKPTQPGTRLLISDFGLGKNLPENVSTLIDPTGNAGTSGWKAPELITQPRDSDSKHSHTSTGGSENGNGGVSGVKRAADIFSLGCLFFWVLTDGVHPFEDENGWQQMRELNIKRGKKDMSALSRWSDAYEPMQLIASMLEHQPEDRPTAQAVLNHPYFWSADKRLAFLCDCSDHFEREPRGTYDTNWAGDSPLLDLLESRARGVMGDRADFLQKLHKEFVDTLGKQRRYSGNRLLDLLRALRNKKNHYEDMGPKVQALVGPLPDGYLAYWSHRFPRLLMACYDVVHEAGLQGNDRFRGYFALGTQS